MQPIYELTIKCTKTGLTNAIRGPYYSLAKINGEKEMFDRYPSKTATIEIIVRDVITDPLSKLERIGANDTKYNSFDIRSKKTKSETITLSGGGLTCEFIYKHHEKNYVKSTITHAAMHIYDENIKFGRHLELMDSLWFTGFLCTHFDQQHCDYFDLVLSWVNDIGRKYEPNIIAKLKSTERNAGIYVNGFYTTDVARLCEYCQQVFGVDKYETAKLFIKRDILAFGTKTSDVAQNEYNLTQVAAIYAENGNVEKAREYYKKSNRKHKLEEFESYVEKNGTSVLSSRF